MAVSPVAEIAFDEDQAEPILAVLDELTQAGTGWVNFVPEVEPGHEPPPRNPVVAVFSARGEAIPLATWSAPAGPGGRPTLGIEHGSGPKALARLDAHQLGLGSGWLKVADHPRRGLVVTAPGTESPADVLWWLLAASHALSVVPLTGSWLASVYRP